MIDTYMVYVYVVLYIYYTIRVNNHETFPSNQDRSLNFSMYTLLNKTLSHKC